MLTVLILKIVKKVQWIYYMNSELFAIRNFEDSNIIRKLSKPIWNLDYNFNVRYFFISIYSYAFLVM